jgi:hypothetical protein
VSPAWRSAGCEKLPVRRYLAAVQAAASAEVMPRTRTCPAVLSTRLSQLTAAVVRRGIDVPSMSSEQGQTLVEFALILPLLLLLVIGIFDFGSAFNSKNDLNFLANTAARYAEVNACAPCAPAGFTGPNAIRDYVKSTADTSQLSNNRNITFTLPSGTGAVGDPLLVTACAPFAWLGGVTLPGLPTGSLTLRSSVTVRILQASDGSLYSITPAC